MFKNEVLKKILDNLSRYKKKKLSEEKNGIYIHPRYKTRKRLPYILPDEGSPFKNKKNLLQDIRNNFLNSKYSNIRPHKYFHHLNSSQAMCINFFYPLITTHNLKYILSFLSIKDKIDYSSVEFEKNSGIEKTGRKTNFDFFIKTKKYINIYFEIKYTERKFGKTKNDKYHRKKFKSVYLPKLNNSKHIIKKYHDPKLFFENYQILRNLINIDKNSYVIFLYLKDNDKLKSKCREIKTKMIHKKYMDHFKHIGWFEIYDYLKQNIEDDLKYLDRFYDKYLSYRM